MFLVFDNQFGNVDSLWRERLKAQAQADRRNAENRRLQDSRYWYIVLELEVQ